MSGPGIGELLNRTIAGISAVIVNALPSNSVTYACDRAHGTPPEYALQFQAREHLRRPD